ncbi:MAG: hypothetical protein AAGC67_03165 [Myxococcota bacterium]
MSGRRDARRHERGIVLILVLVVIAAMIMAVTAFQRRAMIDTTVSANRLDAAEADALARGGLRLAEVLLVVVRAKQAADSAGATGGENPLGGSEGGDGAAALAGLGGGGEGGAVEALWQGIGNVPIELGDGRRLRVAIEDEGAKLNLNALVPPAAQAAPDTAALDSSDGDDETADRAREADDASDSGEETSASEEAVEYLTEVLQHVIDGMPQDASTRAYDAKSIAENILDFMDGDGSAINGRSEDEYYRRQDPPYRAWNQPLVSVDQLALVEDIDAPLLDELRKYVTVHPIGATTGINLNRATPWVLKLVYAGSSGDRRLIGDRLVEDIYALRDKNQLACSNEGGDPRCVGLSEIGNGDLGNGEIYPPVQLPATPAVFKVTASATVGGIERRFEAIYDTRTDPGPQLLSWRRLRGND